MMGLPAWHISDLPEDLQVLIYDFVEVGLGEAGLRNLEAHRLRVKTLATTAFPEVEMWTDYRNRAYSEAMVGRELPPVVVCGDKWLDGRHRIWAARVGRKTTVDCIDLADIGLSIALEHLGALSSKPT
jgi:hypothetical protein